mgnify:CR=1 FL=1|jgi:transcriptional regulator with XRE-family HTH domain|tara:strand:- start:46 stop:804 length:759 start_codon:yes stop_codon:yes gene_type:complete
MTKNDFIKYILERGDKSIQKLADASGVSRNNFYNWVANKSSPRHATINKLANALGLEIKWIDENKIEILSDVGKIINKRVDNSVDLERIIQTQQKTIGLLQEKLMSADIPSVGSANETIPAHFYIRGYWSSIDDHTIEDIKGNTTMLGYTCEEIIAMGSTEWLKLFHPDDKKQMNELVKFYLAAENSASTTFETRFKVHRRVLGKDEIFHHFRVLFYRYNRGYYDAYYYYLYKISQPEETMNEIGLQQTMPN